MSESFRSEQTNMSLIDSSQAVLECVHVARRTASAFYSDEGVPTQHEENVRQQILEGLIAAKGGGLSR
jgi:hypothetical protein